MEQNKTMLPAESGKVSPSRRTRNPIRRWQREDVQRDWHELRVESWLTSTFLVPDVPHSHTSSGKISMASPQRVPAPFSLRVGGPHIFSATKRAKYFPSWSDVDADEDATTSVSVSCAPFCVAEKQFSFVSCTGFSWHCLPLSWHWAGKFVATEINTLLNASE